MKTIIGFAQFGEVTGFFIRGLPVEGATID
jgi:hypothetical protein